MKRAYESAKSAEALAHRALDAADKALEASEIAEEELSNAYGELLRLHDQERDNTV